MSRMASRMDMEGDMNKFSNMFQHRVAHNHGGDGRRSPTWSVYSEDEDDLIGDTESAKPNVFRARSSERAGPDACKPLRSLKKTGVIRRGGQGVVYTAIDLETNEEVAVKRLYTNHRDHAQRGFSECTIREITIMKMIDHPHVLSARRVVFGPQGEICIAVEKCLTDIASLGIGARHGRLSSGLVQHIMRGLLEGIAHLHSQSVIHRDVKSSNVLVKQDGGVCLGDLGSARVVHSSNISREVLTPAGNRSTLLYRAPECLLGVTNYTEKVDLWSAGVVFAELSLGRHLFNASGEIMMINGVWSLVGTPTPDSWPGFSELPASRSFQFNETEGTFEHKFAPLLSLEGFNLLKRLMTPNPEARISAEEALQHPYFAESALTLDERESADGTSGGAMLNFISSISQRAGSFPAQQLLMAEDDDDDDDDAYY